MRKVCASFILLAAAARAAAPDISEFMAANMTTLRDEDGDAADWIEIRNPGSKPRSLAGWHLTDDPGELDKWTFPAVSLPGGGYLVVFASGKNRRDPAGNLHTNFRLNAGGEYLALVEPGGKAVAREFAPAFPPQKTDFSYGIGLRMWVTEIVPVDAPLRVLVPPDDSLGRLWTGGAEPFDDSGWLSGAGGVGYAAKVPGFLVRNYLANTGVCSLGTAEQVVALPSLQSRVTVANTPVVDFAGNGASGHYNRDLLFPGAAPGVDEDNFAVLATGIVTIPEAGPWTFGVMSDDGFVLDLSNGVDSFRISYPDPRGPADTLGVFNVTAPGEYELRLLMYECGGGAMVELFAARGGFAAWNSASFRLVGDTAGGGLAVVSDPAEGEASGGLSPLIGTDLEGAMRGVGASVYVRIPLTVDDPAAFENLFLRMRYEDGFVAYLNGVEAARRNAPAQLSHVSRATSDRALAAALVREDIDISAMLSVLRPGANLLAFHGLNDTPASLDFLLAAELAQIRIEPGIAGFFATPTPGGPNAPVFDDFVRDARFSVERGFFSVPFEVEIETDTHDAEIRYTLDGTRPTAEQGAVYTGPIAVAQTTCLRAAAFREGFIPANVATQTYIFLDDVIRQDYQATLNRGFPPRWGDTTPDYGMDPRVIGQGGGDLFGGKYSATIKDDLLSLPTMSIVLPVDDLFGPNGIYTNSVQRGVGYERAASVELLYPDGAGGFQEDCGLRIQGGAFRNHGLTLKHSFRLLFKGIYGATKLRYPLFGPGGPDRFDTITLRANANDSYALAGAGGRALYVRDTVMRGFALDMGQPACRDRFVHLYLNGVYWGVYNPVERADASFSATYFGGDKADWDVIVQGNYPTEGTGDAWNRLLGLCAEGFSTLYQYCRVQGRNVDGTPNPLLPNLIEVRNYIDYMIVNLYGGNTDWPHNNWRVSRNRDGRAGFRFYLWDTEFALGLASDLYTNLTGVANGVAVPWAALRQNAEFRMLLADRINAHFHNGGALAVDPRAPWWNPARPECNRPAARFRATCDLVERAMVAESARWGDMHNGRLCTRDEHWAKERDNLLANYFPARSAKVVQQFRDDGLYPPVEAPVFSRHGGAIDPIFVLRVNAAEGTVYYTLDGSDPRLVGGAAAPGAAVYVDGLTETILGEYAPCRVLVPRDGALGTAWTGADFDDSEWRAGAMGVGFELETGYEPYLWTSVREEMYGTNASVYIRVPFVIENVADVAALAMDMRYDDGFIAYINGRAVAMRNAPMFPSWNSRATASRPDAEAVVPERIKVENAAEFLRPGANILAIHGLNHRVDSSDMLISATLEATLLEGGGIPLAETTLVRARARLRGQWSAITEAVFHVFRPLDALRITEIMYHPLDEETVDGDAFEFIELKNTGGEILDLSGVAFTEGIRFAFPEGSVLGPGGFLLLVADYAAFQSRYPGVEAVFGVYDGKLSNSGERIVLADANGDALFDFTYGDAPPWPAAADGGGASLVPVDPASPGDLNSPSYWCASAWLGGSPGEDDPGGLTEGGWQVPGDINQDGRLDISDAVSTLRALFGGAPARLPCQGAGPGDGGNRLLLDLNADARVDIADVIHLLGYLFAKGPSPALGVRCTRIAGCPSACR